MKKIMIATSNEHKLKEFKTMLEPFGYEVKSLLDLPDKIAIEENGETFGENAMIKAKAIYDLLHIEVIADDSGLCVDAMDGAPGIYSARFMGHDTDYQTKNKYIIEQCAGKPRGCQFVCAIAYIDGEGKEYVFEGEVCGTVAHEIIGPNGFGYDPIFYYEPFSTTLGNVSDEQKNKVSHRSVALGKFIKHLKGERTIHVVLYEPEIPQNTGNIMRTCMAANVKLHLIEPLGFSLDEKHVRRAGMDYIKDLDYTVYPNWEAFLKRNHEGEFYYMTRYGKKAPSQFDFTKAKKDIYLVLGKESTGIPKSILHDQLDRCMRLPMVPNARSLNLSNCAAIIVYEVLRQLDYPNLCTHETIKGEDWLDV